MTNNTLSRNWIQWFIGFLDAEGNFQVSPKKRTNSMGTVTHYGVLTGFHLGLHIRELVMLEDIQRILGGIGTIYQYPHKGEAHYAITRKDDLRQLIDLIFTDYQLLTVHQFTRLARLRTVLGENIQRFDTIQQFEAFRTSSVVVPTPSSQLFDYIPNWIVGFINGEGSFSTAKEGRVFVFYLEHTDKPVLDMIREELKLGLDVYTRSIRGTRKPTFVIRVSSADDISKVVAFLDANEPLKGYKLTQYTEWRAKWLAS